jgi:hypothetical protein
MPFCDIAVLLWIRINQNPNKASLCYSAHFRPSIDHAIFDNSNLPFGLDVVFLQVIIILLMAKVYIYKLCHHSPRRGTL